MIALHVFLLIAGILLVIVGGNLFVNSSIDISKRLKIPPIIVGATIVSIGTTLPEAIVSCIASAKGEYGISFGNAVGSVIFNTAFICGLSIMLVPQILKEKDSPIKYIVLIFTAIITFIFGIDYKIAWYEGLILFIIFFVFMFVTVFDAKKVQKFKLPQPQSQSLPQKQKKLSLIITFFLLGAAMIGGGSFALVEGASKVASAIGISNVFIGLTIVSIGTSLPELVTTIIAIKKKNSALGYGNIIGANILNFTFVIGLSAIISGKHSLTLSNLSQWVSVSVAIATILLLTLPIMLKNKTYRWQGICLFSLYVLYFAYLVAFTALGFAV